MSDTTAQNLSIASVSIGSVVVVLALIFYSRFGGSPAPILATSSISALACLVFSIVAVALDTSSNYGWSFIGFVLSFIVFAYSWAISGGGRKVEEAGIEINLDPRRISLTSEMSNLFPYQLSDKAKDRFLKKREEEFYNDDLGEREGYV